MAASFALEVCAPDYRSAVRKTWHYPLIQLGDRAAIRQELVRYATLAPSSHNTQCWKFETGSDDIIIRELRERV